MHLRLNVKMLKTDQFGIKRNILLPAEIGIPIRKITANNFRLEG